MITTYRLTTARTEENVSSIRMIYHSASKDNNNHKDNINESPHTILCSTLSIDEIQCTCI